MASGQPFQVFHGPTGLGSRHCHTCTAPLLHLRRDRARPCHAMHLDLAHLSTSAPPAGSPLPPPRRDWAHPLPTSAPGLSAPLAPPAHRDCDAQPLAFKFEYRALRGEVAVGGVYLRVYRNSLRAAAEQTLVGASLPHLHQDCARPSHTCTGTELVAPPPPSRFAHELMRVAVDRLETAVRSRRAIEVTADSYLCLDTLAALLHQDAAVLRELVNGSASQADCARLLGLSLNHFELAPALLLRLAAAALLDPRLSRLVPFSRLRMLHRASLSAFTCMNSDELKSHMLLLRCAILPRTQSAGGELHRQEEELLLINSGWILTPLSIVMMKHWPLDCRAECSRLLGMLHNNFNAFRALFLTLLPAEFDVRLQAAEADGDAFVAFVDASHCTPLLIWNDDTRLELHEFVEAEHRLRRDELLLVDESHPDTGWDLTRAARLFRPTALAGEVVVCGVYLSAYCSPSVDLVGLSTLGLDEQRLVEKVLARLAEIVDWLLERERAPGIYALRHAPVTEIVGAWQQQKRALHLLCAACFVAVQRRHELLELRVWEVHLGTLLELVLADARLSLDLSAVVLPLLSMLLPQEPCARALGCELHIKPLLDVLLYADFAGLPSVIQLIANSTQQYSECAAQLVGCGGLFPLLFALMNDGGDGTAEDPPAVCTAAAKLLAMLARSDECVASERRSACCMLHVARCMHTSQVAWSASHVART